MQIQHTLPEDVPAIFKMYDDATAYMKTAGNNHWLGFEQEMILKEISENRHFKITADGRIVATFCITLGDPLIWKDSGEVKAVYLHRIAVCPHFRGNNVLKHIIVWAKHYAAEHGLERIRLDTGAGNGRLINHYVKNGFNYLGDTGASYTPDLPAHYQHGLFALLDMPA